MAIPDFKDIVDLVKKGATVEAQEKIMQLRETMLDFQEETLALRKRVAELEATLNAASEMEFRKPFYFRKGDDQPFCPLCWEMDKTPLHLIGPYETADGDYCKCNHCKSSYKV